MSGAVPNAIDRFWSRVAMYLALVLSAWTNGYTLGRTSGLETIQESECPQLQKPEGRGIVPAVWRSE